MEKKIIFLLISTLFITSCATTSGDLKKKVYPADATFAVGKINVLVNGSKDDIQETFAGKCLLSIDNEGATQNYRLEKSGEFYMAAKPGAFYIKSIKCGTGHFSESSYLFYPNILASVLERGKINYVGDLTINWMLGDSKFSLVRFLNESGNILNRYGNIEVAVKDNNSQTMEKFFVSHQYLSDRKKTAKLIKVLDATKFE